MTRPGLLGFRIAPNATQGIDWAAMDAIWAAAGTLDVFSAGWLSDHLSDAALERGGTGFESLTTAAALAHRVPGKWIGIAVLSNTFRDPAIVAKAATAIDNATGGRFVLGLGAGWHEGEHAAFGIPLPPMAERFTRYQSAVATGRRSALSGLRGRPETAARTSASRSRGPYTPAMSTRRLVILTEGQFGAHHAKTAMGVIRYATDRTVAVLDSSIAGRNVSEWLPGHDIPAVATLADAMALPEPPDTLLIGIAPTGGKLPPEWRTTILAAIDRGLEVHSGLHTFLGDDPEFSAEAAAKGVRIVDYRRPPERHETAVGRPHAPGKRVILTVGTDCAIGKMSVALELRRAALAAGDKAVFLPTGQTGMMIDGWGVAVDRVISDFVQGTVEWMLEEAEGRGDWIIVEGQGSLDHPAYSSVTLGLIHGATPQAMVMVHKPGLAGHDWDHVPGREFPIAKLPEFIRLHETVAGLVAPSKVVGVALNTMLYPDEGEAREVVARIAEETGLPTADPVRFGGDQLWAEVHDAVDALPWVARALPMAPTTALAGGAARPS